MTSPQPINAPRPNHSTGPKTPEGKSRCRLNAYRHGLTGQLNVFTPEEQQAFDIHCKIIHEALAPVGDYERKVAQSIASDQWRLDRARAIDNTTFALGMQADETFAQARTWFEQAHNLHLLTVYMQRIERACARNIAYLDTIQTKRKEIAKEAMRQAKLLYQLAEAEGKPYQPEAYFITAPEVRESVFSTPEIAREISRDRLFQDAENFHHDGRLPKKVEPKQPIEAAAGRSGGGDIILLP